jgi:hypothetical protein
MKTKQKNNKILPAKSACCGAVVRNECRDHFSITSKENDKTTTLLHNSLTTPLTMVWGPHTWPQTIVSGGCEGVVTGL